MLSLSYELGCVEFELICAGEIVQLRLKKKSFDEKRRDALNKILDIKGSEIVGEFTIGMYIFLCHCVED